MPYWSANDAWVSNISAERRESSSTGNESGEGFPAAKEIIVGSARLLKISRIAEGLSSASFLENLYYKINVK